MPPPLPNPAKRMTANPARPVARYRPGKAVQEDDSSEEEESEVEESPEKAPARRQPPAQSARPSRPQIPVTSQDDEDEEDEDEEGFVTDEEENDDKNRPAASTVPGVIAARSQISQPRSLHTQEFQNKPDITTKSEQNEVSEEGTSENEDSDEEEESSSEDEAPQRKFLRPTFTRKTERKSSTPAAAGQATSTMATVNDNQDESLKTSENAELDEQTRRLAQADLMIKDKLERDAIARAQGKKAWDDDDDLAPEELVDDTDGLDPDAEYAAWRLRELQRLKRDRETLVAREKELEEIERRRNLTAEEREKEDREFIDKQKEEREEGRSKANYLSKYHHKGAFFQDDEAAELLRKRDLMGARFADDVTDKSTLPEYMRVRDMTKLGKKGRTRYTDLKGQDTGRFGDDVKRWRGSGYDNLRKGDVDGMDMRGGIDERFLPDRDRESGGPSASGANASAVGPRRHRSRSRSPKRRRDDSRDKGDSYRPSNSRRRSRSLSPSASRSPPGRRRRSSSPYRDRDKRRRIEA